MKKYDVDEIIKLVFAFTVCAMMLISIVGIIISGKTTSDNSAIRSSVIDLMTFIAGVILGNKLEKTKNNIQ